MMRVGSGRGWGLFFCANRRQAAGIRQCPIARAVFGLLMRVRRRLREMMRMLPMALPAENNRPGEKPQRNQEKSAKINKDLSNVGSGGNQFSYGIVPVHAGKKNWSNHN
jgi:hypothetical protein